MSFHSRSVCERGHVKRSVARLPKNSTSLASFHVYIYMSVAVPNASTLDTF